MRRCLVAVTLSLDPELLQAINDNVKADSQSEKIRKCVEKGYEILKAKE